MAHTQIEKKQYLAKKYFTYGFRRLVQNENKCLVLVREVQKKQDRIKIPMAHTQIEKKQYLAKKYFIYGFRRLVQNENKCLVKDRIPSMRAVLEETLEVLYTSKEINIQKTLKDYLSTLEYYSKKSALYSLPDLKFEFDLLIKTLHTENSEVIIHERDLLLMIRNIKNKISKNYIYNNVLDLVFNTSHFGEIDKILHYIVNELIYEGFSLKFLDEWISNEINLTSISIENIDVEIGKFKKLKSELISMKFYIYVYNKDGIISDLTNIGNELKIRRILKTDIEHILKKEYVDFLQEKKNYDLFEFKILARDSYKALGIINEKLVSYYQLILKMEQIDINKITVEKVIFMNEDNICKKIINKNHDETILYSLLESKERKDLSTFINYRKRMYQENINIDEITAMQRSLNLINNNEYSTIENRLINTWSSIEYILTYHSGGSIISKVKDVIPKLVVLYYMNEKINGFFHRAKRRLYKLKQDIPPILTELIEDCCNKDDKRYNIEKFITFIDKHGSKLISKFEFDIILAREIAEIGLILNDNSYRKNKFNDVNINTINEIIRIYRLRNVIVHSGFKSSNNYNIDCLNLYQYGNNLLGMIIYFKNKNINSSLDEILHSISYSYDNYLENIIPNENKLLICKPTYLFI